MVGALLSLRAATSILSRVLIPWMVGQLGRVRLLAASAAGSALLTAALPLAGGTATLGVLLAAAGFLLGIGQPLTMSMVVHAVPEGTSGTALAIRLTGNRFGQWPPRRPPAWSPGPPGCRLPSGCSAACSAWPPWPWCAADYSGCQSGSRSWTRPLVTWAVLPLARVTVRMWKGRPSSWSPPGRRRSWCRRATRPVDVVGPPKVRWVRACRWGRR